MIPRDVAAGLALTTTLALVGPVALARGADPAAFAEGQRLAGVWYAVLQPVSLATLAAAAALALDAARPGTRADAALSLLVALALTTVFFGGWSTSVLGLIWFAAKTAAVAWGFGRVRRRLAGRDAYRTSVRALVPAAFASAMITAVALAAALGVRTPMGQGILAQASGGRLWIGGLGLAYFAATALVTALAALAVVRVVGREAR